MQDTMILYMFKMKINTNMTQIIIFLEYQTKPIKRLNQTREGLSIIDKIFQFYTTTRIHLIKREKEKMVEAWKRHSKTYVIRYDQINLAHSDI